MSNTTNETPSTLIKTLNQQVNVLVPPVINYDNATLFHETYKTTQTQAIY